MPKKIKRKNSDSLIQTTEKSNVLNGKASVLKIFKIQKRFKIG